MEERNQMKMIKLKSDNFNCLVTESAYKVIRLQMSSGDFGSHTADTLEVKPNDKVLIDGFIDCFSGELVKICKDGTFELI